MTTQFTYGTYSWYGMSCTYHAKGKLPRVGTKAFDSYGGMYVPLVPLVYMVWYGGGGTTATMPYVPP